MRISRKRRPKKLLIPHFNVNHKIEAEEVRILSADGSNLGVFSRDAALQMADEQELDLVEINPKADPPVCQITDFTHLKYQKEKEARKQKAKQHVSEIKGIRLSMRIGKGDLDVRRKQAEKFLDRGDKVKAEIILRGAERFKTTIAYDVIREFYTLLSENYSVKYEQEPLRQGNKITAIIIRQ